jgi:two-component system CheB/CheR fusion protein
MIGRCAKALYVEDHADTRTVISSMLARSGLEVHQAADAEAALRLAESIAFDLLLLDVGLPGLSGLELLPKLRALHPAPSVAITAYAYPADIKSCYEAGFDRCLVKPVPFDALLAVIRELCGG